MSLTESPASASTPTRAWVTWAVMAVSVLVFIGLNRESKPDTWEALGRWGSPSPDRVWRGAYWGLATSVFVHREIWHIALNMYWIWMLGARLEQYLGAARYLLFFVSAAIVSSGCQLYTGATGIGMSGVVYAIFGFMVVLRGRVQVFRETVSAQTVRLFIAWALACVIMTQAGVWQVGNAAHIGGMAFGMAAAGVFVLNRRRQLLIPAFVLLVVGSLVPLFWCPWSPAWLAFQATNAFEACDYAKAISYCDRIIDKEPRSAWAYYSRGCSYFANGEPARARIDFEMAAKFDSKYPIPEECR